MFSWRDRFVVTWGHGSADYRNVMTIGGSWPNTTKMSTTANVWKSLVMSYNGATILGYENGVALTASTTTAPSAHNVDSYIGRSYVNNGESDCYIKYCYIWKRAITASEAVLIHAEPYAMFQRPRRVKYFIPAAAPEPGDTKNTRAWPLGTNIGMAFRMHP